MKLSRVLGLCLLMTPGAFADFTIYFDTEFSGQTAPTGPAPWMTASFVSLVGGGMELTIDTAGLTGGEFISNFYFNFNPSLNPVDYHGTIQLPAAGSTHTDWQSYSSGTDVFKADGDGFFDFTVEFRTGPPSSRFVANEIFKVRIAAGDATINADDFFFQSVNGPVGKNGFYAAAHVQGIGPSGADSGWVTGGPNPVPEPGSIALLGTVLGGAFYLIRKRRASALN